MLPRGIRKSFIGSLASVSDSASRPEMRLEATTDIVNSNLSQAASLATKEGGKRNELGILFFLRSLRDESSGAVWGHHVCVGESRQWEADLQ